MYLVSNNLQRWIYHKKTNQPSKNKVIGILVSNNLLLTVCCISTDHSILTEEIFISLVIYMNQLEINKNVNYFSMNLNG